MIHAIPTEWVVPRETKEWVGPIVVTVNGVPESNFKVALLAQGVRPVTGDWGDPVNEGGEYGVIAQALTPDKYIVWVKYSSAIEDVVLDNVGVVVVT